MHIIHIASELAPIAKVGGLADVVYGLSKELCRQGHTVEIILPKYDCIHHEELKKLKIKQQKMWSHDGPYPFNNTIWSAEYDGLKLLLIEPHHPQSFFNRGTIYSCHDDAERFIYFSRAAMEYLHTRGKQIDVIHLHDWPTALCAVLFKEIYQPLGMKAKGTLLTIHNIEHQGRCSPAHFARSGLNADAYLAPDKMGDPYFFGNINLLMGGIAYADRVTTVSPNYAKEIQTPEGGGGLHLLLWKHQQKIQGILNGIDETYWNPEKDPYLKTHFPTQGIAKKNLSITLQGKEENKKEIRALLGLKQSAAPLVATISRLVPQKSPALIKHALLRTLEKGGQFLLLGSSPIPEIQKEFEELQFQFKNNEDISIQMHTDEALAHAIFAASDMFLIPSLFEPCGLTQLIALRYGSVPITRLTGGLADTVFDIDTAAKPLNERNGFTFEYPDAEGVNWALDRALDCYVNHKEKWHALMVQGMRMDFSWEKSAQNYIEAYRGLEPVIDPPKKLKITQKARALS